MSKIVHVQCGMPYRWRFKYVQDFWTKNWEPQGWRIGDDLTDSYRKQKIEAYVKAVEKQVRALKNSFIGDPMNKETKARLKERAVAWCEENIARGDITDYLVEWEKDNPWVLSIKTRSAHWLPEDVINFRLEMSNDSPTDL